MAIVSEMDLPRPSMGEKKSKMESLFSEINRAIDRITLKLEPILIPGSPKEQKAIKEQAIKEQSKFADRLMSIGNRLNELEKRIDL